MTDHDSTPVPDQEEAVEWVSRPGMEDRPTTQHRLGLVASRLTQQYGHGGWRQVPIEGSPNFLIEVRKDRVDGYTAPEFDEE